ncbi:daptide biosynthesis RiPP recognition protein [Streptomyces griseus]|uniref:daptide biosynthesis RiPP recognition protein n=1 Tax=Streptomyces griseus TaxID=1911 RepID=UPI0005665369|nr:daptide biosynthesis RiPP recognition protein [Streptomyces griseus]
MNEELIARVGRHLRSWVTGRPPVGDTPGPEAATVVLEDSAFLDAVLGSDAVGPRTLVLVPGARDGQDGGSGATVVGYEGSLSGSEGDASVDDALFLQIQDYGVSPYMSLLGTTLVRMAGDTDFEMFLADADAARAEGRFAPFAVSPAVQIADLSALGGHVPGDGPGTRLYVDRDGGVSVSPQGLRLGTAGDSAAALHAEWQRLNAASDVGGAVPLGAAVSEEVRGPALSRRPWLARYLTTLDVLRDLQTRGITEPRVSGFGHRLVPGLEAVDGALDAHDPQAPFLCWTSEKAYVRVPALDRTFQLGRRAAAITEMLLVLGSAEAVLEHAERNAVNAEGGSVDRAAVEWVLAFFADKGVPLLPGAPVLEATA